MRQSRVAVLIKNKGLYLQFSLVLLSKYCAVVQFLINLTCNELYTRLFRAVSHETSCHVGMFNALIGRP